MCRLHRCLPALLALAPLTAGATGAGEPPADESPQAAEQQATLSFGQFLAVLMQADTENAARLVAGMADINEATPDEGITAMHAAIAHSRLDIVEALLLRGARTEGLMKPGLTPLGAAAMKNDTDAIALLLKHGAKLNHHTRGGVSALKLACAKGNVDAAQVLLAHGADPGSVDSEGHTALSLALEHAGENSLPLIRLLLERGASPEAAVGELRWRPLLRAIAMRDRVVAELLLQAGADPRRRDAAGKNALDYAQGMPDFVELLRPYLPAARAAK